MDDWASDDEADLGDIGAELDLPQVELPPQPEPAAPVIPAVNAWSQPRQRGDARSLLPPGAGPGPRGGGGPPGRRTFDNGPGYQRRDDRGPPPQRGSGGPGGAHGGGGQGRPTVLYVSNLPSRTDENEIGSMFHNCGVSEIRVTHHSDTGNVKAAFVTIAAGTDPGPALGVDGSMLGNRPMHVKIDGSDRPRGGGGGGGGRERAAYGSGGFGVNGGGGGGGYGGSSYGGGGGGYSGGGGGFGGRRSNGDGGGGAWGGSAYEPAGGRDGARGDRDRDRGGRDREPRVQQFDPTIPTGPPSAGRKKLNLKPRTKPAPKLDIDHRAIGDKPRATGEFSRPGSRGDSRIGDTRMQRQVSETSQVSQESNKSTDAKGDKQFKTVKTGGSWDQKKSGKDEAALSSKLAGTKIADKSDDAPKPSLKNTFALLGEGDE